MVGPRKLDTGKLFEVVRQRFMEELDYRLEATHQRYFQGVHRGDPKIRIPAVVEERSSRRVLTTELVHGQDLEHAARAPIERRAEYARVLWRFVFKGNLVGGRFNADPHPGNYIFHDDGGITFLDFGCVQPLDDADLVHARRAHAAALVRDEQTFRDAMRGLLELQGGTYQEEALRYTRRCFEPLFASPFHMTRDYVGGLFRAAKEMKREMFAKDKSFVPPPPNLVFMNRLQFGFYSVLARLDAVVDFAAVEREFVAPLPETRASSGPELALK
jgi:predicted unusual protein kinase regulating ubiquinone biosynthesis (AarF/ABC1/UbiB family)